MEGSGISVVVLTYNCAQLLKRTLASLTNQSVEKEVFEVIVVDDGSSDNTREIVSIYKSYLNMTYCFQDDLGFRAAAARNLGISRARFAVVLFIDAGIILGPTVLRMHLVEHATCSQLAVLGLSYGVSEHESNYANILEEIVGDDVSTSLNTLSHFKQLEDCRTRYLRSICFDLRRMRSPWLIFWSGHASVSTKVLSNVGGYDEWFNRWGGEDVELGLRLHLAGCYFRVLRTIASIHYPHYKNPNQKRQDARLNTAYIHQKHALQETALLMVHGWEFIAEASPMLGLNSSSECSEGHTQREKISGRRV